MVMLFFKPVPLQLTTIRLAARSVGGGHVADPAADKLSTRETSVRWNDRRPDVPDATEPAR